MPDRKAGQTASHGERPDPDRYEGEMSPEERFAIEYAARKRDEGTERDPLVRVQRVIERLRRPI